MASKYERLTTYMQSQAADKDEITFFFKQLESILGFGLPRSAFEYRAWWANEADAHNRPHARAWTTAGFLVDAVHQTTPMWVRFKRIKK